MKENNEQRNVQMMPVMEAVPVNVVQPKDFVINCSKCGASLTVKSGKTAYICPVCRALFRLRMGTRIVKDIPVKEKQIHLTLTETAVDFILERDAEYKEENFRKKKTGHAAYRRERREDFQPTLETLIAEKIRLRTYEEGDLLKVDLVEDELIVEIVKKTHE